MRHGSRPMRRLLVSVAVVALAGLSLGARWTVGVLGYADWVDMKPKENPAAPLLLLWPELESAHVVGKKDDGTVSLVLGTGSPFASTLRRPALFYVGFRAETLRGVALTGV